MAKKKKVPPLKLNAAGAPVELTVAELKDYCLQLQRQNGELFAENHKLNRAKELIKEQQRAMAKTFAELIELRVSFNKRGDNDREIACRFINEFLESDAKISRKGLQKYMAAITGEDKG